MEIKKENSSNPSFTNMRQMAAQTGIPLAVISGAKNQGCPAFRHSRIYLYDFLRWHFQSHPGAIDVANEKALLTRAERIAKERENRIASGELVNGDKLVSEIKQNVVIPFKNKLYESARKNGWEKHLNDILDEIAHEFESRGLLDPAQAS